MTKFLSSLVIVATLLILWSIQPENDVYSDSNETMTIDGEIDSEVLKEFRSRSRKGLKHLVISSSGGDIEASLSVAEIIQENGIDVTAKQYCLSACASYVLLAGRNRVIQDGTLLAFHHGSNSFLQIYESFNKNGAINATPSEELVRNSERERKLYEKAGVDIRFLYRGNSLRDLRCVHLHRRDDKSLELRPEFKFAGFIPSNEVLKKAGYVLKGSFLFHRRQRGSNSVSIYDNKKEVPFRLFSYDDYAQVIKSSDFRFFYNINVCSSLSRN